VQDLGEFISAARGAVDADRLPSGGRVGNVFTHEIVETAVALRGDRIVRLGDRPAREVIDLDGRDVCPGLIDAHAQTQALASVRSIAKPAHARAQHDHYKPVPAVA
jgi:adenine deaminase